MNKILEKLTNYSLLLMILVSFLIVVLRYLFGLGWVWLQELVLYFHSFVFLFGVSKTLELDKHVRVDILYSNQPSHKKALINKVGFLLLCLPVCLIIFYSSFSYSLDSWKWFEKSSDAGGLPLVFILKTFIPLFALLLAFQAFKSHFNKKAAN